MFYKKLALLSLSFLLLTTLVAQERKFKNEFHLNATGFVGNYLNFGNGPISNNPFLLGYKRVYRNKAIRFGAFGSSSSSNRVVNPQQPRSYRNSKELELRTGFEWRKMLNPKWMFFYGLDLAVGFTDNRTTNFQNVNFQGTQVLVKNISSFAQNSYGGGPIAGLQWDFSKRISLLAESRAYFNYSEIHTKTKWEDVPDQLRVAQNSGFKDQDNVDYLSQFQIFLPLDLFVIIKF